MFPTGVGMNRQMKKIDAVVANVPHRRGDEPMKRITKVISGVCSPQAWG